ncbi:MAG: inorganic pyrophosphatase [Deltaproteobacteria bacterium]|nr:inorganic pyrophosphatase [Deltaproteobacteria bacterium]
MSETPRFERFRPHPWHGLPAGAEPPLRLWAYVEITPFDPVKYEVDKASGYLKVDRPQRTSSLPPALYGFVPRTYCDLRVAALSPGASVGDGDPLDICVLSERPITRSEVLLPVRVVGGLRQLDQGAADDKIIAVLENDALWGAARELSELPVPLVDRLQHYFATYKLAPGEPVPTVVQSRYGKDHAAAVVQAALEDYRAAFQDA